MRVTSLYTKGDCLQKGHESNTETKTICSNNYILCNIGGNTCFTTCTYYLFYSEDW